MKRIKRTSKIWACTSKEFKTLIETHKNGAEVLRTIGLRAAGGNHKRLHERIREERVEISHWLSRSECFPSKRQTLEEVMVKNSTYSRGPLKKRLIKNKIIPYQCGLCSAPPEWRGKALVLVLDHINGVYNDHRKENLRFLCPNCNSQTSTFAGKKLKVFTYCEICGKVISKKSARCRVCAGTGNSETKIHWPTAEELVTRIKTSSCLGVAKELGVSDRAVRKRIQKHPKGEDLLLEIAPKKNYCPDCGKRVPSICRRCKPCSNKNRTKKINWPEIGELEKMILSSSYIEVAEKFGVVVPTLKRKIRNGRFGVGESNPKKPLDQSK